MTLEEAQSLKPGDVISGAGNRYRVLTKVWLRNDCIQWWEKDTRELNHTYEYDSMDIVSQAEPLINNSYPIY